MGYLQNKLVLFIGCCLLGFLCSTPNIILIPLLISLSGSAIAGYTDSKTAKRGIFILFFGLSCYNIVFLFFLPLLLYDFFEEENPYAGFIFFLPLVFHFESEDFIHYLFILVLSGICFLLHHYYHSYTAVVQKYRSYQDLMTETEDTLKQKNIDLLEKQDYEVKIATLNERNRIAREIHDSVGHTISSSLIQIGALTAITDEPEMKEHLTQVKETLSTGMDSIRSSIHNIHEESLDLDARLKALVREFSFCPIHYDYNIVTELSPKAKYSVIFIVKEALSNIIKHSNAAEVKISLLEHPGFYQFIIHDNGTVIPEKPSGMGISNIIERITQLNGHIDIQTEKGYRIFITLPKGEK